jgi:molybdenum cofactor sulfurtransferase
MNLLAQAEKHVDNSYDDAGFNFVYEEFLRTHPEYAETALLDEWRKTEYGRLDENRQIYLDYTGGGLYGVSQLRQHTVLLEKNVLGNPHSANPTSLAMTDLVEETRRYVLQFFNTSSEKYTAVFTANASGALKLVGEAYPFASGGQYALTFDNHNSVNGIREFARSKGAHVQYVPVGFPDLRMEQDSLDKVLDSADKSAKNLFAFPAQSNFSGVKHPLSWIKYAQKKGWDVLLDAAAFVPASRLDLSALSPDFVCISFYKMFGYPTGIGMLLIRNSSYEKLERPWFAGGTVNFASVQGNRHYLAGNEASFEDGTINYLNIPAVKMGLQHLEQVGIELIGIRVRDLTDWMLKELFALRHSNGKSMVRIYGPVNMEERGGTVTLNFYSQEEYLLDYRRIEELAKAKGISLRTGCFCNPGAGETAEGLTQDDMQSAFKDGENISLPSFVQMMQHRGNKSAGAIRISVGLSSNFEDVYRFLAFATTFRNKSNLNIGKVTMDIANCRVIRDGS